MAVKISSRERERDEKMAYWATAKKQQWLWELWKGMSTIICAYASCSAVILFFFVMKNENELNNKYEKSTL